MKNRKDIRRFGRWQSNRARSGETPRVDLQQSLPDTNPLRVLGVRRSIRQNRHLALGQWPRPSESMQNHLAMPEIRRGTANKPDSKHRSHRHTSEERLTPMHSMSLFHWARARLAQEQQDRCSDYQGARECLLDFPKRS